MQPTRISGQGPRNRRPSARPGVSQHEASEDCSRCMQPVVRTSNGPRHAVGTHVACGRVADPIPAHRD